jgi:DNA-binding MarR family transcriptional regulator
MNAGNQSIPQVSGGTVLTTSNSSSPAESFTPSAKQSSRLLLAIIQQLQDAFDARDFTSGMAVCLFTVASSDSNNPPGVLELGKGLNLSSAGASRILSRLGRGLKGEEGLGLVELTEDPSNWSRKLVRITPKGERLMEALGDRLIAGMTRM